MKRQKRGATELDTLLLNFLGLKSKIRMSFALRLPYLNLRHSNFFLALSIDIAHNKYFVMKQQVIMISNYIPYLSAITACFFLVYLSITSLWLFRLHARVRDLTHATRDLDYAELANLIGDVASLKVSLKKTNGRITGLDSPKYNLEEQIAHGLAQGQQNNVRNIGG